MGCCYICSGGFDFILNIFVYYVPLANTVLRCFLLYCMRCSRLSIRFYRSFKNKKHMFSMSTRCVYVCVYLILIQCIFYAVYILSWTFDDTVRWRTVLTVAVAYSAATKYILLYTAAICVKTATVRYYHRIVVIVLSVCVCVCRQRF